MTAVANSGERFDAIVIGGGVGGLVASAFLARARLRTLLLEARDTLGGCATTEEFAGGFNGPTLAHTLYALDPQVVRELRLRRRRLRFAERDMNLVALRSGGLHLVLPREPSRRAAAEFLRGESEAYFGFKREAFALARRLRPWWRPEFASYGPAEEPTVATLARSLRLPDRDAAKLEALSRMSAASYLDGWFQSDALKTALSFDVVMHGLSPQEPGSALVLIWRHAQESCGRRAAVSQPRGGPSGLIAALERAARRARVEIRTGTRAESILVEHGRAAGITLANGEAIRASAVVSSLDLRRTFLDLAPASAIGFGAAENLPQDSAVAPAKLLLALNGTPPFVGLSREDLRSRILIAERPESAAEAKGNALSGRVPDEFVMEVTVPTAADPALARKRNDVLSAILPDMPVAVDGGWEANREELRKRAIATLESYAPGLKDRIAGELLLTPADIATRYGRCAGTAGPAVTRLLASYQARIRTILPGLYLCGSAAEPVDAISGCAARIAASLVFDELQAARRSAR